MVALRSEVTRDSILCVHTGPTRSVAFYGVTERTAVKSMTYVAVREV